VSVTYMMTDLFVKKINSLFQQFKIVLSMKKYFFTAVLVLFTGLFVSAQNLNSLINEVAKSPNAKREVVDGATAVKTTKAKVEKFANDTLARLLPVMQKVDSVEMVSTQTPDSVITELIKNYKIGVGDSIIKVTDRSPFHSRTIAHKEDGVTAAVFILIALDPPYMSGAVMKFSGKFDEADLKEMATNKFMGN